MRVRMPLETEWTESGHLVPVVVRQRGHGVARAADLRAESSVHLRQATTASCGARDAAPHPDERMPCRPISRHRLDFLTCTDVAPTAPPPHRGVEHATAGMADSVAARWSALPWPRWTAGSTGST
jgi:hypothetical protein